MQLKGTLISLAILLILLFSAVLMKDYFTVAVADPDQYLVVDSTAFDPANFEDSVVVEEPELYYGLPKDSFTIVEGRIRRNQSISELLLPYNVTHEDIYKLAEKSRDIYNVNRIRAGNPYTLFLKDDSIKTASRLIYEPDEREYIVFHISQKDSFKAERVVRKSEYVEKTLEGVIDESLSVTITNSGGTHELTNRFVDIFAWQIDFFRLQKGDWFKVLYEEEQIEGKPVGIHRIKSIYFNHFNNNFWAFAYDQGEGLDYFDERGNSLRKALLKYPLEFTRISSRYTLSRYHPVQKRWKSHKGTDLVAPTGTPIRSVGEGIVEEARYARYNGNFVKIRHNATYTTQYLHMSKIATGVRPGVKVKSGQVIGFVGSTGLATGPHLCYRFWKNGVQVDALNVELPPSQPIFKDHKEPYKVVMDSLMLQLDIPEISADSTTITLEANATPFK